MEEFEYEKKKKKLKKEPIYMILCLLCLVIGSVGGYWYSTKNITTDLTKQSTLYDEMAKNIESFYLDTTDSQYSLQERILAGMVAALGDLHSSYLTSKQAAEYATSINGSFEGIGVLFRAVPFGALALDVYEGTPANQAGLMAGDLITHVEGTSIAGYDSDKIKERIQGEKGTSVSLKILRNGQEKTIQVTRNNVESSVNYHIDQNIGYLQITTFGNHTTELVEKALQAFQKENIKNICIDLRDNGGGYLDAARGLLDLFLPNETTMFQVVDKKDNKKEYKSTDCQKYTFDQGFILVNNGTASASEVMTSALKEQLNYTVIGETTYGKGTVQTQISLSDSSVLKLTYQKWLTSQGTWINEKGITPDYEVKRQTMDDIVVGKIEQSYQYDQVDEEIETLQKMLKIIGYQVDRTDGYFSKQTENALKQFENKYGLKTDGIYSQKDATLLLSATSYYIYQEATDTQYQKVKELIK